MKSSDDFNRPKRLPSPGGLGQESRDYGKQAPKVQAWNKRTQANLSGKRTLLPNHSGKLPHGTPTV